MHSSQHPDDRPPLPSTSASLPSMSQHPSLPPFSQLPSSASASDTNTTPASQAKKKPAKRRRPNDGTSDSAESSSQQPPRTREGPKKKKANRACFHCQKAHLTCDDSRPCQRCIKRGMAANCTEGHRKKAKYLLDEEELELLKRTKSADSSSKSAEPTPMPQSQSEPQFVPPDPMFSYPSSQSYTLSSEGANLEYSILSAILGNSPDSGTTGSPSGTHAHPHGQPSSSYATAGSSSSLVNATWPAEPYGTSAQASANGYPQAGSSTYSEPPIGIPPSETTLPSALQTSAAAVPVSVSVPMTSSQDYNAPTSAGYTNTSFSQQQSASVSQPGTSRPYPYTDYSGEHASAQYSAQPTNGASSSNSAPPYGRPRGLSSTLRAERPWAGPTMGLAVANTSAQAVYDSVTKPYDYTEGYHFLMKNAAVEEDEVFVEKCFQRSLIELDKLVSFSGTPTVAWRRTGEICLVGPEFCMLTGWEREELVGRRKYIYELFENQSVVEYWENFANHAFENTTQSVYSTADIMDLPSLVIGQWLPLL
ncbi:hypothetical protein B0H21DRAFT_820854 [Amylocystis lapponica]|nr:hypothetical protein B0H21DRAFT_820854 [Amylocystis lapponica]